MITWKFMPNKTVPYCFVRSYYRTDKVIVKSTGKKHLNVFITE